MDGGLIYADWGRDKGVEIVHCDHDKSRSPGHKTNSSADYSLWRDWGWTPEMDMGTVHTNWTPLRHRIHNLQVPIQSAMDVTDLTWRLAKWLYVRQAWCGTSEQSGHRNEFISNVGRHADVKSNVYRYARWFYYDGGGISATYHVLLFFPPMFLFTKTLYARRNYRLILDKTLSTEQTDHARGRDSLPVGHGLLIHEISRTHSTTHHSR